MKRKEKKESKKLRWVKVVIQSIQNFNNKYKYLCKYKFIKSQD